ncbi:hypothetical protein FXN61_01995 [Lentzea sp. PSKA42]|uniref:Uncharacterized protein n=1 Tax=Lentzea indica TaxID=2604800 RepID=A0ABX1F9S9_9PSEU|nr:hypothetical protein [Lentzea indica]NKE55660.1 hypothetical protein [Lentzea indica]
MADRSQVLIAIYQSDRADRSTTLTVSLATMGAAVTYLVGTMAFYDKLDLLGWAIALLPFPLVCIAAFHANMLTIAAVRARSILLLERELTASVTANSPFGINVSDIGVTASEHSTNVHTAQTPQRIATIITYAGVGAIYLAYIALMLVKAARHLSYWITVPVVAYTALLIPIALAWRASTALLDFRGIAEQNDSFSTGRPER